MRKNFTHRTIFTLLCTLLGFGACRAAEGVGVTLLTYTIDSANSAGPGYTITISALLTNFDSLEFHDTINFGLRGDHQNLTHAGIFGTPKYNGTVVFLHGHEIVPALFTVRIEQQYFAPGPAVVVVWPICTQHIGDSVVIDFTVLDPTGISTEKDDPFTYVVLNNRILLKNQDTKTAFKQVRIYNLLGQQVSEQQSGGLTEIPLPTLPHGIYICELLAADSSRKVIKFLH